MVSLPAECPFCRRIQAVSPVETWKSADKMAYVSRYWCACGKKFNFYVGHDKTWTAPKPRSHTRSAGACKDMCSEFNVKKPVHIGRYEAGQSYCRICEVWVDYGTLHEKDGSPATEKSTGWFCNCCNNRVGRRPKSRRSKEALASR